MKLPLPLQPLPASAYSLFVGVDSAARAAVAAWILPGEMITRPITTRAKSHRLCLPARTPAHHGSSASPHADRA
jgi:hypothetical protein